MYFIASSGIFCSNKNVVYCCQIVNCSWKTYTTFIFYLFCFEQKTFPFFFIWWKMTISAINFNNVWKMLEGKHLNKKKIILRLWEKWSAPCVTNYYIYSISGHLKIKNASIELFCLFIWKTVSSVWGLDVRFSLWNEMCSKKDKFMCIYKVPYNPFYYHNILQSIKYYI